MLRPASARNPAFTLVELLVVITIIAIIAALLLTVLARSKARALQIQCAGNLRQLGLALQEFKTDHHYYPPHLDPSIHSEGRNWQSALNDQMGIPEKDDTQTYHTGVWRCPAARLPADLNEQYWGYYSYGYNTYGLGAVWTNLSLGLSEEWIQRSIMHPPQPIPPVSETEVIAPAEMIALGDNFLGTPHVILEGQVFGRTTDRQLASLSPTTAENTRRVRTRHAGKANVAFCDGHVESPTLKSLFEDTNDIALARWNRDHQPHRERL